MTTAHTDPHAARRANLRKGDAIRIRQAALKRRINRGEVTAETILLGTAALDEPDTHAAGRLTAFNLVDAMPHYGVTRTRKALTIAGVPENKRIDELADRQRHALADWLGRRHDRIYTRRAA